MGVEEEEISNAKDAKTRRKNSSRYTFPINIRRRWAEPSYRVTASYFSSACLCEKVTICSGGTSVTTKMQLSLLTQILTLLLLVAGYLVMACLGINIGYHRLLSHRSFQCPLWLERFLVVCGLPAGTPIQWVGNHRRHHMVADTPLDIHSPHHGGFWHAHVGWYIGSSNPIICALYSLGGPLRMLFDGWWRPRTNDQWLTLAKDVGEDPFLIWLSRPKVFFLGCVMHAVIPLYLGYLAAGFYGIACIWLLMIYVYNCGDAIDSFAHLYGEKSSTGSVQARNNRILGYMTFGEGWHDNHHSFPSSACHGILKTQPDVCWRIIKILESIGLASNLSLPRRQSIQRRMPNISAADVRLEILQREEVEFPVCIVDDN
jgi:fatty-acid desaturase